MDGRADHEPNARAVDHRADLERNGAAEEVEPKTAFDRMWLARAAQQRTQAQETLDESAVANARAAERKAAAVREDAEARLKASRAAADALKPPTASHK